MFSSRAPVRGRSKESRALGLFSSGEVIFHESSSSCFLHGVYRETTHPRSGLDTSASGLRAWPTGPPRLHEVWEVLVLRAVRLLALRTRSSARSFQEPGGSGLGIAVIVAVGMGTR